MNKTHLLLGISFLIFSVSSSANQSSNIPDRREFPVDMSINPCEDFYSFACSKVKSSFKLRDDRSSHYFSFDDSEERLLTKKKEFFKNLLKSKVVSSKELALKNYYSACINKIERKKSEHQETKQSILNILKKIKTREDFFNHLSSSYLNSESSPISWGAIANFDHSEVNDLYLSAKTYLSLPEKSYYSNQQILTELENIIILFFQELKMKNSKSIAKSIIEFEKSLALTAPSPEEFRQIINNRNYIHRDDLVKNYPQLHFTEFLKSISQSTLIRNWAPDSLSFLNKYFQQENVEDLKNILIFNALKSYWDDAYPQFYNANFQFHKKYFGGPSQRSDRHERCTKRAMEVFAKEIDSILLPQLFPNFPKEKFIRLAEGIRSSIISSLSQNNWLSKEARSEAIRKMQKARLQLVSPENEIEWDFLPEATYSATNAISNEKTVAKVMIEKNLKMLREASDKGKWMLSPLTVNAYYDSSYNKFVMPIGILQYPFYDPDLSDAQNAGAVGAIIGHELGHAVDDQGSRYDSDGKQRQWMSMDDLKKFSDRTRPLIAQFDSIGHNGRLTQGENIGDLVGLTAAYLLATQTKNFHSDKDMQREFFLSWARSWCDVTRPKYEENYLKTDPHSLPYARVNQQVKLQPGFAKAFQCKPSDKMVLSDEQRVQIW